MEARFLDQSRGRMAFQIPRKMYRRALHEAMALKISEENIIVVDRVQLSESKTRELG
jgi:ribosomal protein L4